MMELKRDPKAVVPGVPCAVEERARLRKQLANETFERNGALRWKINQAVIMTETFKEAGLLPPERQAAEREKYVEEGLREYMKQYRNHKHSAQEMAEMDAAFGPGEVVVNVLTGDTYTTK
jgi:hypothetical protein